jgi:hypothetical protein
MPETADWSLMIASLLAANIIAKISSVNINIDIFYNVVFLLGFCPGRGYFLTDVQEGSRAGDEQTQ